MPPPIKPDSSLPWGPPAGPHGGSIVLTAPAACTSATPLGSALQVSTEMLGRRWSLRQREATVWFQAHEMYSKQRSALCMPGLGWTAFLNLITPFRRRERNVSPFTLGEVATYVSLLGTEPWCQKGPCPHSHPRAVGEAAGSARGGGRRCLRPDWQAITDKTCTNASLSRWAPFPGRLPVGWQSLAPAPFAEREGVWMAAIPECMRGRLFIKNQNPGWHVFKLHAHV